MFDKLEDIERRWRQAGMRLYEPEVINDNELYTKLLKDHRELMPIAEKYQEYKSAKAHYEEAAAILEEETDRELRDMAKEQLEESKKTMESCTEELKILLIPKDPNEDRSVIMEIRSGTGGEEAALFAADLYRMYSMYADSKGWKTEIIYANATELGGYKEISFSVEGEGVFGRFRFESGTHRVQRVPVTDSQGKIQTSAVTVAVLPEAENVEVEIDPNDLKIDTFRSSGAGGQHINKTSSAIRITHLPTGMVVECQDERSQYKNKDKAMKVLRSRLYEQKQRAADESRAADRKAQVGSGDRSERIRTYNFPQGRVTDHRIGLTLYKIDSVINGGIDELIDPLRAHDQAEKLRGEEE
ncbi:MAG: peptide chain release factor 1 [Oscillospiraceae bacterium]|nr:peptide chain release factor 1 [Oscillospiraceae bacterium]MBQ6699603.1 peptide chain release factor 1 [Oscillospiraceae bacterium]